MSLSIVYFKSKGQSPTVNPPFRPPEGAQLKRPRRNSSEPGVVWAGIARHRHVILHVLRVFESVNLHVLDPCFLSQVTSHDVASSIWQALMEAPVERTAEGAEKHGSVWGPNPNAPGRTGRKWGGGGT